MALMVVVVVLVLMRLSEWLTMLEDSFLMDIAHVLLAVLLVLLVSVVALPSIGSSGR